MRCMRRRHKARQGDCPRHVRQVGSQALCRRDGRRTPISACVRARQAARTRLFLLRSGALPLLPPPGPCPPPTSCRHPPSPPVGPSLMPPCRYPLRPSACPSPSPCPLAPSPAPSAGPLPCPLRRPPPLPPPPAATVADSTARHHPRALWPPQVTALWHAAHRGASLSAPASRSAPRSSYYWAAMAVAPWCWCGLGLQSASSLQWCLSASSSQRTRTTR